MPKGIGLPSNVTKKREPLCTISWPGIESTSGGGINLNGDTSGISLGKRCRVTVEGVVTGFRTDEYGGSLDLKTKTVSVDRVSQVPDEEGGEPMTDMIGRMQEEMKD